MLLPSWNEIGRKLIAMAEDFPEDKHDFKPTPAQRSFAEQLLHTAGSNDYFTDVANGRKPIGERLLDDVVHQHVDFAKALHVWWGPDLRLFQ